MTRRSTATKDITRIYRKLHKDFNITTSIFCDWEDFFIPEKKSYIAEIGLQRPHGSSIFVVNPLFQSLSSSSQGRYIYIDNSNSEFLIEESSFIEISVQTKRRIDRINATNTHTT